MLGIVVLVRNSFWNGPQSTLTGLLIKEKKGEEFIQI